MRRRSGRRRPGEGADIWLRWELLAGGGPDVGFDPNGNQLVTLYQDGTGVVWDVDPDHWKQRACSVAGRSLNREEWDELLPRRGYQPACR